MNKKTRINIGIVGCGKGATSIIDLLRHDQSVNISFLYDSDSKAPGIKLAKTHKISILDKLTDIGSQEIDVVLNLTGSVETGLSIKEVISEDVELIGAKSAKFLSSIMDERLKRLEERDRVAGERAVFRKMGEHMQRIDNIKDAGFAIINYASSFSALKAVAVSYYDEESREMVLIASSGLEGFKENMRWRADECAATARMISKANITTETLDSLELEKLPGKHFTALGVKTMIAVPLIINDKLRAIIYLCDFIERIVLREDLETLSLFSTYASLIIDRVYLLEKMRHLTITDGLTGLNNQRYFMERFEREYQRSARYEHPLSIVVFEVDDFKAYAKKHGHVRGNELLKELSGILIKSVRETDISARFTLEKFSILLCEIPKDGAFIFAQRLVERIANHPMERDNITISAGVATHPGDARNYMELLSKARGNLHKAKEWGGNRTCS